MNSIQSWGMEIVRAVQRILGPGMMVPMQLVTLLGSEYFALAALPLIYWCVDRRKGARIGIVILLSSFLNLWCKLLLKQPRPYDFDPSVGRAHEDTYGLPSGHAQTSITFWGVMLTIIPGAAGIIALAAIPLLVGLSRLFLGVHFPTDLFGGWALGGLVLAAFYLFDEKVEAMLRRWNLRVRLIAISAVALAMNFLLPGDARLSGVFLGSAAGFALASRNLRFSAGGRAGVKALRYFAGIAGTVVLYAGPKLLIGNAFASQEVLVRFLRYALVGLWVAYGAPWCFLKLKLVELEPSGGEAEAGREAAARP